MNKLFTIDTDNAIIRFHQGSARRAGISEAAIVQMRLDLETLALGLANAHDTTYRLQVVL